MNNKFYYTYLPLNLIYDTNFSGLSLSAILLYSLMLNRQKLSYNNPLFNDSKGTFIFFSNPQIQKALRCNKDTARKVLNELETHSLIRKEYQKQGLPLKIYVIDVFGMHNNTYKSQNVQPAKQNFKPYSPEKQVSFDVDITLTQMQKNRRNFGEIKIPKKKKED